MKCPYLTDREIGYIAGLIDGEGYIRFNSAQRQVSRVPIIAVTNTNVEVLNWLSKKVGGHVYLKNMPKKKTHKPSYEWKFCGVKQIKHFLEQIKDLLIIKRPQAELMLEYLRKHKPYSREEAIRNNKGQFTLFPRIPWKEEIYQKMTELNKRGE